jgi:hypothetical protein
MRIKYLVSVMMMLAISFGTNAISFDLDSLPDISDIPTSFDWDDIGDIGDVDSIMDDVSDSSDTYDGVGEIESLSGFTQESPWSIDDELLYAAEHVVDDVSCIEYQITGACFSYRISWTGIKFYTYIQVEHYSRDTHIETTARLPEVSDDVMPTDEWVGNTMSGLTTEIGQLFDSTLQMTDNIPYFEDGSYTYHDAFVMGNPELYLFNSVVGSVYSAVGWCESQNTEYTYYFSSAIDQWSWRMLASSEFFLTGAYAVSAGGWNTLGSNYGSTFPRMGYVEGPDEHKGSVVAALRAMSISAENRTAYTGLVGAHVYSGMEEFADDTWTKSSYETPHRAEKFKLSMIYPYEGESCTRYSDVDLSEDMTLSKDFNTDNKYKSAAFKGYRPFRCCEKKGTYLYTLHTGSSIGYK